jgi:hypothetical protein
MIVTKNIFTLLLLATCFGFFFRSHLQAGAETLPRSNNVNIFVNNNHRVVLDYIFHICILYTYIDII